MSHIGQFVCSTLTGVLLATGVAWAETDPIMLQGAVAGKWTMDLDSAVSAARQKQLPILLNFTGSDWCGWCKVMQREVFSQKEWSEYAANRLLLVWIDAPQDPNLVPAYYVTRNQELARRWDIQGMPTFVFLDDDGQTLLARLGMTRDVTVKSFIRQVERVCRYRPEAVEAFAASLPGQEAQAYRKLVAEALTARGRLKESADTDSPEQRVVAGNAARLDDAVECLHIDARSKALGPEKGPRYRKLCMDQLGVERDLEAWLATKPAGTPENVKLSEGYRDRLNALRAEVEKY